MKNKVHLTIHVPGGFIDPLDYFWTCFRYDIGRIQDDLEYVDPLSARDAWRITKAIGKAVENAFDLSPSNLKYLIILAVNNSYWGGPEGMWEELFDEADIEFSYEVKPMPSVDVSDAA